MNVMNKMNVINVMNVMNKMNVMGRIRQNKYYYYKIDSITIWRQLNT